MNVLLALAVVSCQHYFNFERCVTDTMTCIELSMAHKPNFPKLPSNDLEITDREIKMANAYIQCSPLYPVNQ